jgi:hypothetical protein
MNYQVIDNFLDEENYNTISKLLLSENFPYYYQKSITFLADEDPKYYFNHSLYYNGAIESWFYKFIMYPFLNLIKPKELIRGKVNCNLREETNYVHEFHNDRQEYHKVALWYANTTNGKTILKINDESIIINSVANRMVIFDGNILHALVSQTDTKIRVAININYID